MLLLNILLFLTLKLCWMTVHVLDIVHLAAKPITWTDVMVEVLVHQLPRQTVLDLTMDRDSAVLWRCGKATDFNKSTKPQLRPTHLISPSDQQIFIFTLNTQPELH